MERSCDGLPASARARATPTWRRAGPQSAPTGGRGWSTAARAGRAARRGACRSSPPPPRWSSPARGRRTAGLARPKLRDRCAPQGRRPVVGRGREEVEALAAAEIDSEVVPGVSALTAVPAAAGSAEGQPESRRAGHRRHRPVRPGKTSSTSSCCTQTPGTLAAVVFMGVARLQELADGLVAAGKSPDTPAAVVSNGTTERQHTVAGRRGDRRAPGAACITALAVISPPVHVARGRRAQPTRALSLA